MSVPKKTGVLLVTHGSERKETRCPLFTLVRELRRRLVNDCVTPCFLEHGRPDIATAVQQLVGRGCNHIVVHAFFPAPGKPLQEDVARLLQEALKRHPHVTFELGDAMCAEPGLTDLVEQRLTYLLADDKAIG